VLVVAATERELERVLGADTLVCGIGPVEAGIRTTLGLVERRPDAVLHVGIAGARGLEPLTLVLGSEAIYEDPDGPLVAAHAVPDAELFERAHAALPEAEVLPIGTTARVGGTSACAVEAMEGFAVLCACALAGVPAVELRVVSNSVDEPDRARWRFEEAFAVLGDAVARVLG
jgi:nucleoside phosphorylase